MKETKILKEPKIFSDSYQASIQVFHRTQNFPKALRPTVDRRLEEATLDCLVNIRKATLSHSSMKIKYLMAASEALDAFRTYSQIAKDLGALNLAGFDELSGYTKEIGKQLGGLLKHERPKSNTP